MFLALPGSAQDAAPQQSQATQDKPFTRQQLQQMLAPIALYPDELLSNVLMAATYPLEIVQAARWRKEPANAKLTGDALAKALEAKDWDPSVKSLCQFPDVLQTMSDELEWTQGLGDAFLAQQAEVMDEIQFLRAKAEGTGALKSNAQQTVKKESDYIVIQPASTGVVYVPVYQTRIVYGTWWYPDYPPYYWTWGRPTSAFVSGFFWGTGFAIANSLWGWGDCDWRRRDINIDVDRYNSINVNRPPISNANWKHQPAHRGAVPYRDKASREAFGPASKTRDTSRDFRGFDDKASADRLKDAGKDRPARPDKAGDRMDGVGAGTKDFDKLKPGTRPDKAGKPARPDKAARPETRPASLDVKKAGKPASRPAPGGGGFDIKKAPEVKAQIERGQASRKTAASRPAASRPAARPAGGGGARPGGGGGRPAGGGGRRR